jgi:replicative DNA helicase
LDEAERKRFRESGLSKASLPLAIEERPSLSTAEIAARVRNTRQELASKGQRLGLVIIDHVGKIRHRDQRAPLVQQLGQTSNDLAALAKSEDVVMLALHQLNRGPEQRDNKRPMLADLRDSGNLEQDADGVWLLYRPAYYLMRGEDGEDSNAALRRKEALEKKMNVLEIIVAKNRNGAVGTVDAFCDLAFNVIADADRTTAK